MLCSNRKRSYKILQNHDWCQARMCIITTFIFNSYGLRTQQTTSKQLTDLDFTDDIVLLEGAKDRLQLLFDEISEKA